MKSIVVLSILVLSVLSGFSQKPTYRWDFKNPGTRDVISSKPLDTISYKCSPSFLVDGDVKFIRGREDGCLLPIGLFKGNQLSEFSLMILFRGESFQYLSFPGPGINIRFQFDYFQFTTITDSAGQLVTDNWIVKLDGENAPSYSEIADDKWHSLIFQADAVKGIKQIIVDGERYKALNRKITSKGKFSIKGNDGLRKFDDISAIVFYNKTLTGTEIDNLTKVHKQTNQPSTAGGTSEEQSTRVGAVDPNEFVPMLKSGKVTALTQLQTFPLARFPKTTSAFKNFPWFDIMYFHREYKAGEKNNFGNSDPAIAVKLTDELARNWNYYIELPCLRLDSISSGQQYSKQGSIHKSLIDFANSHPDLPTSTVLIYGLINPSHIGLDSRTPFFSSQKLKSRYYIHNSNGEPLKFKGKYWYSPTAPLDLIAADGRTSGFYLKQLNKHLIKPVSFVNENGELYGHNWSSDLFSNDEKVRKLQDRLQLNNVDFNGWFQNRIDSTYKYGVYEASNSRPLFTFYDLTATASTYWPSYKYRMNLNSRFNGEPRSTPAFYPATPENWRVARGPFIGYGFLAEGRRKEIELGVKLFAPFISAGWLKEENNIRPTQWLALLKSLVMLGADFFHVGYFNVTDGSGKWPNGKGPNDPAEYAYQVALPTYAQELALRTMNFLRDGSLVNEDFKNDKDRQFRVRGKKEFELIMVRKLDSEYLIYGSIQPSSNFKGNVPDSSIAAIKLDGRTIKFKIRRQGSMYVLNVKQDPTFYQLDQWHQAGHPFYWSRSIQLETELFDENKNAQLKTETNKSFDFTDFTSYLIFKSNCSSSYRIPVRESGNYKVKIRARSDQSGTIKISYRKHSQQVKVERKSWTEIDLAQINLNQVENVSDNGNMLTIEGLSGAVELDYIKFDLR